MLRFILKQNSQLLLQLFIYLFLFFACSSIFASQIVIGLNWKSVVVWRYWEIIEGNQIEKMIILNREDTDMTLIMMLTKIIDEGVRVRTEVDTAFGTIGGPWHIPAKNFITVKVPTVQGIDSKKYLFQFAKKGGQSLGLLHLSSRPIKSSFTDKAIITTEGLNGSGGSFKKCWWEHPTNTLRSGARKTVRLNINPMKNPSTKDEPRSIIISKSEESQDFLPHLKLIAVKSNNLKHKNIESGIEYIIPWQKVTNIIYSINFQIEAPLVKEPTIALLPVWHSIVVEGQNISLPMLVTP
ncbi:MAG: hypothetical protein ACE5JB_04295 [bacterium]